MFQNSQTRVKATLFRVQLTPSECNYHTGGIVLCRSAKNDPRRIINGNVPWSKCSVSADHRASYLRRVSTLILVYQATVTVVAARAVGLRRMLSVYRQFEPRTPINKRSRVPIVHYHNIYPGTLRMQ